MLGTELHHRLVYYSEVLFAALILLLIQLGIVLFFIHTWRFIRKLLLCSQVLAPLRAKVQTHLGNEWGMSLLLLWVLAGSSAWLSFLLLFYLWGLLETFRLYLGLSWLPHVYFMDFGALFYMNLMQGQISFFNQFNIILFCLMLTYSGAGILLLFLRQSARDKAAVNLFSSIKNSNKPEPFVLYLRPFDSTGQLDAPLVTSSLAVQGLDTRELEELFFQALSPIGPMVALGKPGENIGAGRVHAVEDDWQKQFTALAVKAKVVVILPSSHAGTLWEVEWLKNSDLLYKCVFVMPSEGLGSQYWGKYGWKQREACKATGSVFLSMTRKDVFLMSVCPVKLMPSNV